MIRIRLAKDENTTGIGIRKQFGDTAAKPLEDDETNMPSKYHQSKYKLQTDTPQNRPPFHLNIRTTKLKS